MSIIERIGLKEFEKHTDRNEGALRAIIKVIEYAMNEGAFDSVGFQDGDTQEYNVGELRD